MFNLLKTFVRVLHCWSTADPDWWVKVASVPEYTAVMGTVVANANDLQIDRQTGIYSLFVSTLYIMIIILYLYVVVIYYHHHFL